MKATIITDKDYQTELFNNLKEQVVSFLYEREFETELMNIGKDDLAFCMGCFGCWVKTPGECVINDMMTQVNRNYINSDVVIYISPVIFGQFSVNIKNALDRWIPNMLPFFETRPDGSTMHPSRYDAYPKLIIIGYSEELSEEDVRLFIDVTKKHRRNIDVLIYQSADRDITKALNKIEFGMVGGHL